MSKECKPTIEFKCACGVKSKESVATEHENIDSVHGEFRQKTSEVILKETEAKDTTELSLKSSVTEMSKQPSAMESEPTIIIIGCACGAGKENTVDSVSEKTVKSTEDVREEDIYEENVQSTLKENENNDTLQISLRGSAEEMSNQPSAIENNATVATKWCLCANKQEDDTENASVKRKDVQQDVLEENTEIVLIENADINKPDISLRSSLKELSNNACVAEIQATVSTGVCPCGVKKDEIEPEKAVEFPEDIREKDIYEENVQATLKEDENNVCPCGVKKDEIEPERAIEFPEDTREEDIYEENVQATLKENENNECPCGIKKDEIEPEKAIEFPEDIREEDIYEENVQATLKENESNDKLQISLRSSTKEMSNQPPAIENNATVVTKWCLCANKQEDNTETASVKTKDVQQDVFEENTEIVLIENADINKPDISLRSSLKELSNNACVAEIQATVSTEVCPCGVKKDEIVPEKTVQVQQVVLEEDTEQDIEQEVFEEILKNVSEKASKTSRKENEEALDTIEKTEIVATDSNKKSDQVSPVTTRISTLHNIYGMNNNPKETEDTEPMKCPVEKVTDSAIRLLQNAIDGVKDVYSRDTGTCCNAETLERKLSEIRDVVGDFTDRVKRGKEIKCECQDVSIHGGAVPAVFQEVEPEIVVEPDVTVTDDNLIGCGCQEGGGGKALDEEKSVDFTVGEVEQIEQRNETNELNPNAEVHEVNIPKEISYVGSQIEVICLCNETDLKEKVSRVEELNTVAAISAENVSKEVETDFVNLDVACPCSRSMNSAINEPKLFLPEDVQSEGINDNTDCPCHKLNLHASAQMAEEKSFDKGVYEYKKCSCQVDAIEDKVVSGSDEEINEEVVHVTTEETKEFTTTEVQTDYINLDTVCLCEKPMNIYENDIEEEEISVYGKYGEEPKQSKEVKTAFYPIAKQRNEREIRISVFDVYGELTQDEQELSIAHFRRKHNNPSQQQEEIVEMEEELKEASFEESDREINVADTEEKQSQQEEIVAMQEELKEVSFEERELLDTTAAPTESDREMNVADTGEEQLQQEEIVVVSEETKVVTFEESQLIATTDVPTEGDQLVIVSATNNEQVQSEAKVALPEEYFEEQSIVTTETTVATSEVDRNTATKASAPRIHSMDRGNSPINIRANFEVSYTKSSPGRLNQRLDVEQQVVAGVADVESKITVEFLMKNSKQDINKVESISGSLLVKKILSSPDTMGKKKLADTCPCPTETSVSLPDIRDAVVIRLPVVNPQQQRIEECECEIENVETLTECASLLMINLKQKSAPGDDFASVLLTELLDRIIGGDLTAAECIKSLVTDIADDTEAAGAYDKSVFAEGDAAFSNSDEERYIAELIVELFGTLPFEDTFKELFEDSQEFECVCDGEEVAPPAESNLMKSNQVERKVYLVNRTLILTRIYQDGTLEVGMDSKNDRPCDGEETTDCGKTLENSPLRDHSFIFLHENNAQEPYLDTFFWDTSVTVQTDLSLGRRLHSESLNSLNYRQGEFEEPDDKCPSCRNEGASVDWDKIVVPPATTIELKLVKAPERERPKRSPFYNRIEILDKPKVLTATLLIGGAVARGGLGAISLKRRSSKFIN